MPWHTLLFQIQHFIQMDNAKFSVFAQNKACKTYGKFDIMSYRCAMHILSVPTIVVGPPTCRQPVSADAVCGARKTADLPL